MDFLRRIEALNGRVSVAAFFGQSYNYDRKKPWSVSMKYNHDGVSAEIRETGLRLEDVMADAWYKLDKLVSSGLGGSAMMPAIEASKSADDEIPF